MVAEPVSMGSESLLEQLSRDVCRLRARARQVLFDLGRSRNPGLCARLQRELAVLLGRREQLRQLCVQLRSSGGSAWAGSLSLELLEELCRRPLLGA
ncbi:MAG: hypothetical protein VKL97_04740 [Cyanobacteriota bacterium]|nr:hypothetical protein [Cyanobacteriota bacterium]